MTWPQTSEILSAVLQPSCNYLARWHWFPLTVQMTRGGSPGVQHHTPFTGKQKRVGFTYQRMWRPLFWKQAVGPDLVFTSMNELHWSATEVKPGASQIKNHLHCKQKTSFMSNVQSWLSPGWWWEGLCWPRNTAKLPNTPRGTRSSPSKGVVDCYALKISVAVVLVP